MNIIQRCLQEAENLLKLIRWDYREHAAETKAEGILDRAIKVIETQYEIINKLVESIRLREEDAEKYPNIDFGVSVAKYLLSRGLHLRLKESMCIKSFEHKFGTFSKYREDARGGKGFFEVKIHAVVVNCVFSPPDPPITRNVYAHLHIACCTSEHFWEPNHCGSYICIDSKECFEVQCDWRTGNITIGEKGHGSHIPEWFKKDAGLVIPEVAAQPA